jgi:acrylyl-CoA reductase (NADPH)
MEFNALVVEKDEETNATSSEVKKINLSDLPEGDVLVNVEYSNVNYKDGLCIGPGVGLVKTYPHVPGIDFAGTVETSQDDNYQKGDQVILTGWRVGEVVWGGYSQKARVKSSQLVKMPENMTPKEAMTMGTAGFSAMLSIIRLEEMGLSKENGEVLVTGATGGVGSVATVVLSNLGYEVVTVSGKSSSSEYLKSLGSKRIIDRSELNELIKRPLESALWAGCIDTVGGNTLSRLIGQLKYGASVAVVGNAGGNNLSASAIPFMLRGINMLGIDSAMQPYENRVKIWERLNKDFPKSFFESITEVISLSDLPRVGNEILDGKIKGRLVVDVNL